MTDLTPDPAWPGVRQIEITDPVTGGPDGIANQQATALAARTEYLKQQILEPFSIAKMYKIGERVRLANGDTAVSVVDDNTTNPNEDITGWINTRDADFLLNDSGVRFFKSMNDLLLSKPKNNGQLVTLFAYYDGGQQGGSDLIAIQSSILIENGVTVFRSKVVGYEDYFWVRVNISHITPEMAGAIGDKTYNCRDAFQKCFNVGGKIKLKDNAKYLIHGDDIVTHVGTRLLDCNKPCEIVCDTRAEVYFKHDVTTGSPSPIIFQGDGENLDTVKIEGVNFYGNPTVGISNKVARTLGLQFWGVDNLTIKNVKASTFQAHSIHLSKRAFENNADWIQSTDLNNANTEAAAKRLMSNSSKNVELSNIRVEHCGSTGISMFGVDGMNADGITGDMTGSVYDFVIWTDDASSQTALKNYGMNRNINIRNVTGGSIDLTGCVSGSVSDCDLKKINVRSYDFDQQKDNFDSGTHTYNPDDHLSQPFMWQKWFKRGITLRDNFVDQISIRSIYVDAHDNFIRTTAANQSLVVLDRNGIRWGNGTDYFDEDLSAATGVKNNVRNNTYIVRHDNCIGIDYGTASANSYVNAIDNIIEKVDPALNFTPSRYSNQNYRRNSHYEPSANNGNLLSKKVNHHVDVSQGLLTQGVGRNNFKTYGNIYAGQTAQPIAAFTNVTTSVWFYITLLDSAGGVYRKVVEVTAAGARTVTDKDSQTTYNTAFTVTQSGGVTTLNLTPGTSSLCFDLMAVGTRNNCVFLDPPSRISSSGG